jgi:xylulose-5-phosphate/fructose-6-phosphate phosphoketolase
MLLREDVPDIRIRVVNVVDLMALQPPANIRTAWNDRDFDALFTTDRPVIFAFHGYPSLIHKLTYRRTTTPTSTCAATRKKARRPPPSTWWC